jgi:hypothetical protein
MKEDLQELLESYGKELFKENRLTGNCNYMFKCDNSYLI